MDKSCKNCGKRIIHFKGNSNQMTPCLDHEKCGAWLLWVKEGDRDHLEQLKTERVKGE